MGRKSRQKRLRQMLRPGLAKASSFAEASADRPAGRPAPARRSSAKAKVMKLLEAMVDAANEDLANGVEKPRVSYGQALRAGELLVRYEEEAAEEAAEDAGQEGQAEGLLDKLVGEELERMDEVLRRFEQPEQEEAAPAAQTG